MSIEARMSVRGQDRYSGDVRVTSAYTLTAAQKRTFRHFAFGPTTTFCAAKRKEPFRRRWGSVIRAMGHNLKKRNFAVVTWSLDADWQLVPRERNRLATPHSALAKDLVMVAGSRSRISMSWIWAIASASATLGTRLNEIVIFASSLPPEAVALWLSTSTVA